MSVSKYRSVRDVMTLHRIHVSGSGMPITETGGWRSEAPGGSSAPGCELNSLCFSPANTNLRRHSLRPGSEVRGRAGRTFTLDHCLCPTGCLQRFEPLFLARTPDVHAARPRSSRRAVRLVIRCIRAGRAQRCSLRPLHGPGQKQLPLTQPPFVTLCNSPHVVPTMLLVTHDVYTHGWCLQVLSETFDFPPVFFYFRRLLFVNLLFFYILCKYIDFITFRNAV